MRSKYLPGANAMGRQTDRGEAGYGTATREALTTCEAKLQSPGGIKPSGDEQTDAARSARIIAERNIRARRDKPHTRPTEWDELAQHSDCPGARALAKRRSETAEPQSG